jgi:transcriptional antiterminator NusG
MTLRWYSVSVLSNYEKKVMASINESIEQFDLRDQIEQVLVPTEEVVEVRKGKKIQTERRFMPGYVLVRMEMTDRAYHMIKDTNRVTGFLGQQGKPMPLRDSEVAVILNQVEEGLEKPRSLVSFEIGEKVNVNDGPFEGFLGLVEEVDDVNSRLKVTVSIFGRATPVELEYTQVQNSRLKVTVSIFGRATPVELEYTQVQKQS